MTFEVHRIADPGLGNSAWLADLGDGSALVIDPSRDPRGPVEVADKHGLTIRWVAETHLHADFVSGARELVGLLPDVTHLAPAGADLEPTHDPMTDGAERRSGGVTLRALHTPGHTPEHVAYLLLDRDDPVALFSGGTLIVGGVARPDLIAPDRTESLARKAWQSITGRLLDLPDDLTVYPTHGGGSFCSSGAGDEPDTTIGEQRTSNPLLQADEDAFVERLLGGLGSFPPYFLRLREVNRRGPRRYGTDTPEPEPLTPATVLDEMSNGAQVVDVRTIDRYAAAHIPGSLSIELRDSFATWLGWLVDDANTPLVFIIDDDQHRDDLVRQCLKVGYENIAGELAGGIDAWQDAGHDVATTELRAEPVSDATVVDVRQRSEWDAGHIPDAVHLQLGDLATSVNDLPSGRLVTHCMHGQRSMTAASVLESAGRSDVAVFSAGPGEWEHRQSPTQ